MTRSTLRVNTPTMLVALILLAALVRIVALAALRNPHQFHGRQAGADAIEFNAIALNLVQGEGYSIEAGHPTAFRAPGFPLLLAGLYRISYENYFLVYLVQCLLGGITCGLIYLLAKELVDVRTAWVCSALSVFYFPSIYFSTLFLSETLFSFCLVLGISAFLRYLRTGSMLMLIGSGVALGWATLTRPSAILLLPMLAWVVIVGKASHRRPMLASAAFVVAFVCVLVPWAARNYSVYGKLVLLTTNGGSTFYGGNNDQVLHHPQYWGGWLSTTYLPGRASIDAAPDEVSHDKREWQLGFEWLSSHLWATPALVLFKFVRFWLPEFTSGNQKFVALSVFTCIPFLVLFLQGIRRCVADRSYWTLPWAAVHSVLAAALITAVVFWGSPRFRDGNFPILMLYAGVALRQSVLSKKFCSDALLARTLGREV